MKYMNIHGDGQNSMDMVTLGERGQIVIPAEIRERLAMKPGEKIMVFTKHSEMICLVPASSMRNLVEVLTSQLAEVDESEAISSEQPKKESK